MNQIPKQIGWKRLLLSRQEKFLLDLNRLGQEKDPVEKFIMGVEDFFSPRYMYGTMQRKIRPFGYRLYWAITPKRLQVPRYGRGIYEYLPWFNGSHLYKDSSGRIGRAHGGSLDKIYSWKKAYKLLKKYEHEEKQKEMQYKLNKSLERLAKGGKE